MHLAAASLFCSVFLKAARGNSDDAAKVATQIYEEEPDCVEFASLLYRLNLPAEDQPSILFALQGTAKWIMTNVDRCSAEIRAYTDTELVLRKVVAGNNDTVIESTLRNVLTPPITDVMTFPSYVSEQKLRAHLSRKFRNCDKNGDRIYRISLSVLQVIHSILEWLPDNHKVCAEIEMLHQLFIRPLNPDADAETDVVSDEVILQDALTRINQASIAWESLRKHLSDAFMSECSLSSGQSLLTENTCSSEYKLLGDNFIGVFTVAQDELNVAISTAIDQVVNKEDIRVSLVSIFKLWTAYKRRAGFGKVLATSGAGPDGIQLVRKSLDEAPKATFLARRSVQVTESYQMPRETRDKLMRMYTLIRAVGDARTTLPKRCNKLASYVVYAQSPHNAEALHLEQFPYLTHALLHTHALCSLSLEQKAPNSEGTSGIFESGMKSFGRLTFNGGIGYDLQVRPYYGAKQDEIEPLSFVAYPWHEKFDGSLCDETLQDVEMFTYSLLSEWTESIVNLLHTIPDGYDASLCRHLSVMNLIIGLAVHLEAYAPVEKPVSRNEFARFAQPLRKEFNEVAEMLWEYNDKAKPFRELAVAVSEKAWEYWNDSPTLIDLFGNEPNHIQLAPFLKESENLLLDATQRLMLLVEDSADDNASYSQSISASEFTSHVKILQRNLQKTNEQYILLLYRAILKMQLYISGSNDQTVLGIYTALATWETKEYTDYVGKILAHDLKSKIPSLENFYAHVSLPSDDDMELDTFIAEERVSVDSQATEPAPFDKNVFEYTAPVISHPRAMLNRFNIEVPKLILNAQFGKTADGWAVKSLDPGISYKWRDQELTVCVDDLMAVVRGACLRIDKNAFDFVSG